MPEKPFREVVEGLRAGRRELRGSAKLRPALDAFGVSVEGRICLDVGASTGGFTTVLLERGATRVYAVDAGHGQLLGSLRQDPRVVNLEATNIAELSPDVVAETIELFTVDVSYLALGAAVAQLDAVDIARDAVLIGLVKPMFELRLAQAPTDHASLEEATASAVDDIVAARWDVIATYESPIRGANGAIEGFILARRRVTSPVAH